MRSRQSLYLAAAAVTLLVLPGCNRNQTDTSTAATPPGQTTPASPSRSDGEIATDIQSRFYRDGLVRGHQIHVNTDDGVVQLSGTVASDDVRRQAVNVAQGVEGVSRVDDRLTVRGEGTDRGAAERATEATREIGRDAGAAWITTKITAQYFTKPEIRAWNIDVTTSDAGVVTLSGTVPSEEARRMAVDTAQNTEGVKRVDDHLRISADMERRPANDREGQPVADAWITTKIQAKFFADDDVRSRDINVDTMNGVVTLKGEVHSNAERRQAVAIARNTDGVLEVKDMMAMAAPERGGEGVVRDMRQTSRNAVGAVEDSWITTKIQSKYFLEPDVKGREINVDTKNGVVTLTGKVDSVAARQLAESIARETNGVRRVSNHLAVRNESPA
jgi:osmotically-inducible protein OsmY